MVQCALLIRIEAKPGKEAEVEALLRSGQALAEEETATTAWFALRLSPREFGIFDAFPDESGRRAHLAGKMAEALFAKDLDLLAKEPVIERIDVLADKLPASGRSEGLSEGAFAP